MDFSDSGTFTVVLLCYMQERLLSPHGKLSKAVFMTHGIETPAGDHRSDRPVQCNKEMTKSNFNSTSDLADTDCANGRGRQRGIVLSLGLHHFLLIYFFFSYGYIFVVNAFFFSIWSESVHENKIKIYICDLKVRKKKVWIRFKQRECSPHI